MGLTPGIIEGPTMKSLPLVPAAIVVFLSAGAAPAAIRPSFQLDSCAWAATHVIVVTEGARIDGVVEVLESWAGDLKKGDTITVPELAEFAPEAKRRVAPSFLQYRRRCVGPLALA